VGDHEINERKRFKRPAKVNSVMMNNGENKEEWCKGCEKRQGL
jgi:hypothetical protein